MKIVDVRPWVVNVPLPGERVATHLRQFVFVQVDTDEGITGWGEITTYPGPVANRAVAGMVRTASEMLVGEDPLRIEALWHKLFRAFTYVGTRGAVSATVSGIDIALWDITGKALGLSVYRLLGGAVRDRIAPHNPYGPVALAAAGHLAAAIQNFDILEHCPIQPWFDRVQTVKVPMDGGYINVSELEKRPGLGVELDMDLVRSRGHVAMEPRRRLLADGSTPLL